MKTSRSVMLVWRLHELFARGPMIQKRTSKRDRHVALLGVLLTCGCATPRLPDTAGPTARATPAAETAAARVELPNARQPLPGVTSGGKPSEAQLQQARQLGYHTVISLLPEPEMAGEAELASSLGLRFVSIPVPDATALTEDNARRLASAMDAPDAKPLILHCASGNRSGALLALRAFFVDGVSAEDALALGVKGGLTSLRPQVEAQLHMAPGRSAP